MATLAFSLAGQVVGGALGGPVGAMLGRAVGALAGSAVDGMLFGQGGTAQRQGADVHLQGSVEGGAIPRLYGWGRLTGNIIWATELERVTTQSRGAKATRTQSEDAIFANFAVALCEGEVHRLGRIWADGRLLETEGLTIRFHRGTQGQMPDSFIEAKQGAGVTPAYRGVCYIVFERLPLAQFGSRIPNIAVEVCRVVGDLERQITAVTLIPGSTEFGYDPVPRLRVLGPGSTVPENSHQAADVSDWTLSLDELQALCPNLQHVSLVVAWFGSDLRCGQCVIEPKVEAGNRQVADAEWSVAGIARSAAGVVSTHAGGPAYGGTPSDASVLAAIADLNARGLKVTLYPLVMMDIPAGNSLPNPYGGTGQPAYPWRGRITCHPAPGQAGTPDKSGAVAAQVAGFLDGANGYRRMVRHYAQLAATAGGVDAFIIGSELRELTRLRSGASQFPVVDGLVALAAEVRGIVGAGTKLTYAADWSEYAGLQPGDAPGDKLFHLDPLWASPDIDAVGIDTYMPLSDWRDGTSHADGALADTIYDLDYLRANIAGGEGFDWFYADGAARAAQVRSPIIDGAHGEAWVWRYKDLVNWWSRPHHNRVNGVRSSTPTAWTPKSKPFFLTELGCGAVDKGANAPNVFGDAKSSEDARPYFSAGTPDPLMQRQFLRAHLGFWRPGGEGFAEGNNPVSPLYGGRMLDPERIYLWTWDARPYPAFPMQVETWSDGVNHDTGHWLNGRLGALASDELVRAVAADQGVVIEAQARPPLVHGARLEAVSSIRDAIAPVLSATGLSLRDGADGLEALRPALRGAQVLPADGLMADEGALLAQRRPDPSEALGQVVLTYLDRERDYFTGTVTATRLTQGATGAEATSLVLDLAGARHAAERILLDDASLRDSLELTLPPSRMALEVGDVLALDHGAYEITELADAVGRKVSARALAPADVIAVSAERPRRQAAGIPVRALPLVLAAHLPPPLDDIGRSRLALAAFADPWPGEVTIADAVSGGVLARLTRPAQMGALTAPLVRGPRGVWERGTVTLELYGGHLSSHDELSVLAGGNRLLVAGPDGQWEILGFADAELVGAKTYRIGHLLRGIDGTEPLDLALGARVLLLDDAVAMLPVTADRLGLDYPLRAYAGAADLAGQALAVTLGVGPVLPLAPVHVAARRVAGGDIAIAWQRRSRADNHAWTLLDVPLEHAPEAYGVTILKDGLPVRQLPATTNLATYAQAQQVADFGALPVGFAFTIAQLRADLGPGAIATGTFHD